MLRIPVVFCFVFLLSCSQSGMREENRPYNISEDSLQFLFKRNTPGIRYVADAGNIGFWGMDTVQLPVFQFTAPLPCITSLQDGTIIPIPQDPWFLLGNYKFTMFVHASGGYQILTGDNEIARLNYGGDVNLHAVSSLLKIVHENGDTAHLSLAGMNSLATHPATSKVFGCGFAAFHYPVSDSISISRIIATPPSSPEDPGQSCAIIRLSITNHSKHPVEFFAEENNPACVDLPRWHTPPLSENRIWYRPEFKSPPGKKYSEVNFSIQGGFPIKQKQRKEEKEIPSLLFSIVPSSSINGQIQNRVVDSTTLEISAQYAGLIQAGKSVELDFYIGYSFRPSQEIWTKNLVAISNGFEPGVIYPFRDKWRKIIPFFQTGDNTPASLEMQWHAAMLEALTKYNSFYHENWIPLGYAPDFAAGVIVQHHQVLANSMAVSIHNPRLTESILRFTLKHADSKGKLEEIASGNFSRSTLFSPNPADYTSLFQSLAWYLAHTHGSDFLEQKIASNEKTIQQEESILSRIGNCFFFFRDEIGTGPNGLVRLYAGDWNPEIYLYPSQVPFLSVGNEAESYTNTIKAVLYLNELADQLERISPDLSTINKQNSVELTQSMRAYANDLSEVLKAELNHRHFLPAYRFPHEQGIGVDNLWLAPQVYLLGTHLISAEQKKNLWEDLYLRLGKDEKTGLRIMEDPIEDYTYNRPGHKGNGGSWYSLNGTLLMNLTKIHPEYAEELWKRMTLLHHTAVFPNYWTGAWSGPECLNSSLASDEGLPDTRSRIFPVFCSHAHSWPLIGYYALLSNSSVKLFQTKSNIP